MSDRRNRHDIVGRGLPGIDSIAKITGAARYTFDKSLPGMLHGKILRSPHPHARIRSIDATEALAIPGVVAVVTGADLAGLDPYYGNFIRDQPVLAIDKVRYVGDPVAAVAARDDVTAYRALAAIKVEYELLPAVMTVADALADGAPQLFDVRHESDLAPAGEGGHCEAESAPNVLFDYTYRLGDAEEVLRQCAHVFEDRFRFARISHYALEPHVVVAAATESRAEIWSNNQDPFLLQQDIARIFCLPMENVRFHTGLIGGGFGGKSYCKIEPLVVLLARKAQMPVRVALAMDESIMTVCEHAAEIVMRTGVSATGMLVARSVTTIMDGGAYAEGSPSVALRVGSRMAGAYRWQALHTNTRVIRTNTVSAGSFRGFGVVHVTWSSELQIDMIARRLGQDPLDFRLRNFIPFGALYSPTPKGDLFDTDMAAGLEAVISRLGYRNRTRRPGRGIGFAAGVKSAGASHQSDAWVRIAAAGLATIATGVSDIGQDSRTSLMQVAAETLLVPPDAVIVAEIDTDTTPYDSGSHASCGLAVTGGAVKSAAEAAIAKVLAFAAGQLGCAASELSWSNFTISRGAERHSLAELVARAGLGPETAFLGEFSFKTPGGAFYWMPNWTAVEVDVDAETGAVEVLRMVVAGDAGTAVNPEKCRGQIEGGAVQGYGQALYEELAYSGQSAINAEPLRYRVPRLGDLPKDFSTIILEPGQGPGPFGSKGLGEAGNLSVAAAIANAIEDAVGARVTDLPITPAKILAALDKAAAS